MGLLSFAKNAGAKLFGIGDAAEKTNTLALDYLKKFNLRSENIKASLEGSTLSLTGSVDSALEKSRIIMALGNVDGVESIEDNITVEISEEVPSESQETIRYYTVKSGDSLSKIAKEMYGDASAYPKIFEANKPMLSDPDKIYPDQTLVIPA